MNAIKLMIVEDNLSMSASLQEYFQLQLEFNLGLAVTSVEALLALPDDIQIPDMILMDIMLPGMSGIQGVAHALKRWPDLKVVMNSVLEDSQAVYDSLRAGALGYITKDMPLANVKEALLIVNNGGSFMNARIARKVVDFFHGGSNDVKEKLTEKEWDISLGIKSGKSYKMIAAENDMTIDGVRFYIQKIYRKLNINSRGELALLIQTP
jgi:DNA-binding NarL/FixJ family response regulator